MKRDHVIYNARNEMGSTEFAKAVVGGEPYQTVAQRGIEALLAKGWTLVPPERLER